MQKEQIEKPDFIYPHFEGGENDSVHSTIPKAVLETTACPPPQTVGLIKVQPNRQKGYNITIKNSLYFAYQQQQNMFYISGVQQNVKITTLSKVPLGFDCWHNTKKRKKCAFVLRNLEGDGCSPTDSQHHHLESHVGLNRRPVEVMAEGVM